MNDNVDEDVDGDSDGDGNSDVDESIGSDRKCRKIYKSK